MQISSLKTNPSISLSFKGFSSSITKESLLKKADSQNFLQGDVFKLETEELKELNDLHWKNLEDVKDKFEKNKDVQIIMLEGKNTIFASVMPSLTANIGDQDPKELMTLVEGNILGTGIKLKEGIMQAADKIKEALIK